MIFFNLSLIIQYVTIDSDQAGAAKVSKRELCSKRLLAVDTLFTLDQKIATMASKKPRKKQGADRWNEFDDDKLAKLFTAGTLDPKKTDTASISKALTYFPGRLKNSFASTYKRKCTAWNLEKELAGKRKGGARGK